MGQQQLLLVILVTIIVGIATVVAINTFGTAADNANLDAVRQDVATIAASAQGYYMKPAMMDGGGRSFVGIEYNKIAFAASGISTNGKVAWNDNGRYEFTSETANELQVTAYPASSEGYTQGDPPTGGTALPVAKIQPDQLIWSN